MDPQPDSRPLSFRSIFGSIASFAAGAVCFVIGDGKSLGVNPPIPEIAKLGIVLLGWVFIIDGVILMRGGRSFILSVCRFVYRYGLYVLLWLTLGALTVILGMWVYDSLSLKALVAIGLAAAIALLAFILRELRKSRT